MKSPMTHQNLSHQGWQWLCSWMGLIGTPPTLLALLLAGWTPEAWAATLTLTPAGVCEGQTVDMKATGGSGGQLSNFTYTGGSGRTTPGTHFKLLNSDGTEFSNHRSLDVTEDQDGSFALRVQNINADGSADYEDQSNTYNDFDILFYPSTHANCATSSSDGVTISPTSLALTELGASSAMEKTYTMVLDTDPTANVTVTVANGDATAVAVDTDSGTTGDQSTLTFTAGGDGSGSGAGNGNWATAQTVTVRALNDPDGANESFNLTHAATTTGSTAPYHNITIDPVAITTTDAGHGVVVSESSLSVADNDETATYTVVLKSQPSGNVEISTTSGATGTATASPATLSFSSSNWNTPKTVTVTGKGAGSTSISHAVATSADTTNYPTSTTIPAVAVTVTASQQVLDLSFDDLDLKIGEIGVVRLSITATGASGLMAVTGGTSLLTFSGEGITSSDYSLDTRSTFTLTGGPPPSASVPINIPVDNVDEPNETLVVGLQNLPSGYRAGTTASILIIDRHPTTVTLAGSGTVMEDGSDSAAVTVTLSRNLIAGEEVTVPLAISGTGIAGSDYMIELTPGAGNNTGVTLNTNSPHSASGPAVVFTGHSTDTVQVATLRVTAQQDNLDEGVSEALSVGFGSGNREVMSNLDRTSGTGTGGTTPSGTATVTITDDDGAGLAITETANDTIVSEDGTTTDTYTVALNTEPTHDVTVTATASAGVQVAAPGGTAGGTATLTFTTSNYSTAQMVTVTGVDDNTDNPGGGREVSISHAASSTDTNYTIASAGSVSVTVTDDDATTVTLAAAAGNMEEGETKEFTITLGRGLVDGESLTVPLTFAGTATRGTDYTMTSTSATGVQYNNLDSGNTTVVFTGPESGATATRATITLSATADSAVESTAETVVIGLGSITNTGLTGAGGVSETDSLGDFSISDAPPTGLAITETADDTTVSEDGTTTDTYTVALKTEPTHDVTVTATSGDTAAATVNPGTLTFTTSNYSTAQTVTVTGVADNTDNPGSGREVTISHAASSTDPNYTIASTGSVGVTVTDDDPTTVTLAAAAGNMEEGETKEFTITLGRGLVNGETLTVPLTFAGTATRGTDYTMTSTSATGVQYNNLDSGNATVVFTGPESGATATRATITLSATADSVVESTAETVVIGLGSITNTGLTGAGGVSETDSLGDFSISDAPPTGLAITETADDTTVSEDGTTTTDTYTVALKTEPTHDVTVTATSGDTAAATVNPGTLTFTTSDYSTAQTVTVTGVADNTDNPGGGREVSISHAASSTDTNYTIASTGSVRVTVTDDDATTVTLAAAAGNMEEGETKEFTIMLGRGLVDGEILTVPLTFAGTATRGADYTMTGTSATGVQYNNLDSGNATVVFTGPESGATATRATITLRATADNTAESPPETVDIGLDTNTGLTNTGLTDFGGVTSADNLAPFTIADGTPASVSITESDGSTSVTEAAGPTNTDTYTVVLKTRPTATVAITVESDDPGAARVSPATLTFDPTNWDKARTVTVTGVDDSGVQSGNRSVIISHSATSTDAKYNGNTIRDVVATVVDDDSPGPSALPAVEFAAAAYSGGEASGSRTVNVALSATPAFTAATSISYRVSGTATAGEDFTPLPGTVSMTGGAGVIPITILQDQMDDDGETIVLTLIAANGYTVGTQGSTTITITDDDGTTPPPSTLPVVSITGGGGVSEGEEASFTVTATPAPPPGTAISVNVRISASGDFASSGQTGSRSITIDASGTASFTVTTEDDTTQEEDGRITATVRRGSGYTLHGTTASASVTVTDDEVVRLSTPSLRVTAGGSASYQVALDDRPTGDVTVTICVGGVNGEGGAVPSPNLSPPGTSPWDGANTMEGETSIRVHPATLTFTPANWDREQPVTLTAPEEGDLIGTAITLTHTATGGGHVNVSTTMRLTVVAAHASEETKAWHLRLGRTLAHQVVTALEERWSAPPVTGLQLTVARETVPSATALAEHEGLLTKALGFETVTPQELVEGSSFSVAPEVEGGAPRLAFWGQGAFSSFSGEQETLSLDGDVTTLLLGADWHTEHWQAGAALSQSWGSGSYDGENGADGEITSTVTGLFPYGRYALTPRLGLWAITGYGWGELSLKPDGEDAAKPNTTLGMAAVGLDGVLRDGGSEGITLTTTADVLTLKTTSAEVDGLESSEGSLSRRRVGLEAVRPFPLSNGASLLPSMALGIRHDSGDAEAGYGMDLGAAIRWQAPKQGISGELKGHTLLTHTEESLQEQGLALSFSWQPHPSNHGPSLSLSHAMGAIAAGDMDTLLHPTTMEGLDAEPGNGQRLTAELAYGFLAHNDHITLTPALALAFSPTSRNYSLLWSVAPYAELQGEPWELSLTGQRQEQNTATAPVDHSLKLRFSWLF